MRWEAPPFDKGVPGTPVSNCLGGAPYETGVFHTTPFHTGGSPRI